MIKISPADYDDGLIAAGGEGLDDLGDAVCPGLRVVPGNLGGQGGHRGQVHVEADVRGAGAETGHPAGPHLLGDPGLQLGPDVLPGHPGQVLVLAQDDDGDLDRVTGGQAPAEENLGHPDEPSVTWQLVTE